MLGFDGYSMFYVDADAPDGSTVPKQMKRCLGEMSERAALREHARIMEAVNQQRGSIAPIPKGQTFAEAVEKWRVAIAPNLSPATVRPRQSFLRTHIMPRFGKCGLAEIGVHELQTFSTDLRKTVSYNIVFQVLATLFGVLKYAEKCGAKVQKVSYEDLEMSKKTGEPAPFFTRAQVNDIIAAAREPFKTLFAIAWFTGMRAGEILALTLEDLNFDARTIRVNKDADDNTREIREPKTACSTALLPMPNGLENILRNYLVNWKPNPKDFCSQPRMGHDW
jgi:integrase